MDATKKTIAELQADVRNIRADIRKRLRATFKLGDVVNARVYTVQAADGSRNVRPGKVKIGAYERDGVWVQVVNRSEKLDNYGRATWKEILDCNPDVEV